MKIHGKPNRPAGKIASLPNAAVQTTKPFVIDESRLPKRYDRRHLVPAAALAKNYEDWKREISEGAHPIEAARALDRHHEILKGMKDGFQNPLHSHRLNQAHRVFWSLLPDNSVNIWQIGGHDYHKG